MKQIKFYNVIFPLWFLFVFPPVIFITLIGNFIIDSIVILICFFVFLISKLHITAIEFYKKTIIMIWLFGFLSDIIGAFILFSFEFLDTFLDIPDEIIRGINFDPFSNSIALVVIIFAMLLSAFFIFIFNYNITLKKHIEDKKLRITVALTVAIVTMPWVFLLPTKWFYNGI